MMQMQKIKRLCLSHGDFQIVNAGEMQWLGDGTALYAVPGGITIDADALSAMFDLTDKQVRGCQWSLKTAEALAQAGIDLDDNAEADVMLYTMPASVTIAGEELEILYSSDGDIALLVNAVQFTPLLKYTDRQYYARRNGRGWAVAVKNGYALVAYILPWKIQGDAISNAVLRMRDVLGRVIANERAEKAEEAASGDLLAELKATFGEGPEVDPDTGEVRG